MPVLFAKKKNGMGTRKRAVYVQTTFLCGVWMIYVQLKRTKRACTHLDDKPMQGASVHIFPFMVARRMDFP